MHMLTRSTEIPVSLDLSAVMRKVYNWMMLGLALTALVSWVVVQSPAILEFLLGNRLIFYGLLILELGVVIYLSGRIHALSGDMAVLLFLGYAALNGITLSPIFLIYTGASITSTFLVTAATFGVMSLWGYTTKANLTSFGQFLIMGLIGLVIASLVNLFWANDTMYWVLSYAGVFIFVGLTAYDTQKIKRMAQEISTDEDGYTRFAILGALNLYLDFINLFLYLLRFMGRRK